ncbi:MAG TPA: AarF/UbiB family protein [Methanoregulaceae archaeon]|nr:AarF/UbiB family protein [Methanoregulaceae archaeon]HPD09865.1 AarF/UbiB family protein [Methanoregulaceae archaeon]HRT14944.1 AarF/UbiB family protein [Methanoregulaceae archaeon]HRU30441.1 AarF/UbiB family protein [Methanoregulaceae archaeon]
MEPDLPASVYFMVTKLKRYWQIADILLKYEFGSIVQRLFPGTYRFRRCKECEVEPVTSVYMRMRMALEELGPTFIKFGQIMSTRPDLLPPDLIAELKKLQDQVAPLPFDDILAVIRDECPDFSSAFLTIDEKPIASASIAQVHQSTLKNGTQVALKVQRPGIAEVIETDILILKSFAKRIERYYPEYAVYNPQGIVADFARQIHKELDFIHDGKNAARLRVNMQNLEKVRVPKIYWDHSTRRLLVMEYIEGVRIDHVGEIKAFGVDPKEIADRGFYAYMQQIFEDGFFHGDPHPGNLLVSKDGTLSFLDFGIVGVIYPERRFHFIHLLMSMMYLDPELMLKALERLGITIAESDRDELREEIYRAMLESEGESVGQYNFKSMSEGLTEILRNYRITMPQNMMLMLKVMVMVLDVGVTLDPSFNFREKAEPYVRKLGRRDNLLDQILYRASHSFFETIDGVFEMPRTVNKTLRALSTGTVKIDIADSDIFKLQQSLDKTSDKILIGLIVAGVVVGSSLVLNVADIRIPDFVFYLAALAYVVAIVIGLYTIWHVMGVARR